RESGLGNPTQVRAPDGRAAEPRGLDSEPAPRSAEPADGVWGHREVRNPQSGEHWTEPARERPPQQRGEAERESARAGRRSLGASEERSPRSGRAPDGPPESIDPCEAGGYLRGSQSADLREHPLAAAPEFPNISRT